jgi:hypothetical protein
MTTSLYTLPQHCDFSLLGNNSGYSQECSPKLNPPESLNQFKGIAINLPNEVVWPKNVDPDSMEVMPNGDSLGPFKLMVAGLVQLPYSTMNLNGEFRDEILVTAVDQATGQPYSGKRFQIGFTSKPDMSNYGNNQNNTLTPDYFTIDLVQNLKIPIKSAQYQVYATLGEFKSNVITVDVVMK